MAPVVDEAQRRTLVRRALADGDVASLRDLAGRLEVAGTVVTAEVLRSDIRSLGAIRVQHGEGTVLALPVDGAAGPSSGSASRLGAEIAADADWPIQLAVVAVVALFLLVGLLGWLISV